jgi:hypothetical protein
MERRATGAGGIPVQRAEMTTRDMDVIADLINRFYVEHRARFRCLDPARVDAGTRAATTGLLEAAVVRYQGFDYHARVSPPDDFFALVTLIGTGTLTTARDQVHFTRGDVLLDPTDRSYTADMHDCSFALLPPPLGLGQPGQLRNRLPGAVRGVAQPHAAHLSLHGRGGIANAEHLT